MYTCTVCGDNYLGLFPSFGEKKIISSIPPYFTACLISNSQKIKLVDSTVASPFTATTPRPEIIDPCRPSPCGINAECRDRNGAAACTCLPGLQGDPYVECKPECTINPDCPNTLACVRNKCADPCPGVCGAHATCSVSNHRPNCQCDPGYVGDPFTACQIRPTRKLSRCSNRRNFFLNF